MTTQPQYQGRESRPEDYWTVRNSGLHAWEFRHPPWWRQVPRSAWIAIILAAGICLGILASVIGSLLS